ncbi:MAG: Maf-like protein [Bacteroidales bacterium]
MITKKILLASNSPRRREMLTELGINFEVVTLPDIDESYPDELVGEQIPSYIAQQKALAYRDQLSDDSILITADTVVILDNVVFGKPTDRDDAHRMLRELSGNTHQVITSVTLCNTIKSHTFASTTEVTFAEISDSEIDYYINNYKPFDKAGAYGIQEWIGLVAVKGIKGSFHNVVGLPIQRLYEELKKF